MDFLSREAQFFALDLKVVVEIHAGNYVFGAGIAGSESQVAQLEAIAIFDGGNAGKWDAGIGKECLRDLGILACIQCRGRFRLVANETAISVEIAAW